MTTTTVAGSRVVSRPAHWTRWVGYAAAGWSLVAVAFGLWWAITGKGFPWGKGNDPQYVENILAYTGARTGGIVTTIVGAVGAVVAVAMTRSGRRLWPFLLYGGTLAALLLTVIPDRRLLMYVGYAPILVGLGVYVLITGSSVPFTDNGLWAVMAQIPVVLGGGLWLATTAAHAIRTRANPETPRLATPESARKWGRWGVGVAVVSPLIYAATRFAWALGFRLGISEEFYQEGAKEGLWWLGAGLASFGVVGAILTLGLVQRWGEVYPRWVFWRKGRRVPPMLAIVPASIVSVVVTAGGVEYWRLMFTMPKPWSEIWATGGPELFWPFWGVGLAAATWAYYLRRRVEVSAG